MTSEDVDIPAGDGAYRRIDAFELVADFEVRDIWAHMHTISKNVRVWAELPDGEKKELFLIRDRHNTAANPRNPHSPPQRIRLGEGSTDEMSGLIIAPLVQASRSRG